jgi:transposase
MLKVRTTKTASGKTAVQVVKRSHQKTLIIKHIGSAGNDDEYRLLCNQAAQYIAESASTQPLFPDLLGVSRPALLSEMEQVLDRLSCTSSLHVFAYEFLSYFYTLNGFAQIQNDLLRDLSLMRLIEPCSKLRSIQLMEKYFGLTYAKDTVYEGLPRITLLKKDVEKNAVAYAKRAFGFDFSLVFYDVTTLYFESFTEDNDSLDEQGDIKKGLRKHGFGKELKHGQPIIVIGLIVTKEGFPVSYDVFAGNTFEGKTFIPAIQKLKDTYGIDTLTVVADAAMISYPNIQSLIANNLSYIVGARMGNIRVEEMKQVHEELLGDNQTIEDMQKIDGNSTRIQTEKGLLLCSFSFKRYLKDKREMEKQIIRAENLLQKKEGMRRTKFIKNKDKQKTEQEINTPLIEKTKLLLGIKGYYTNLIEKNEKLTNEDIITHYHSLWHVEKAFRIAKNDLRARPIFHHRRESIEAHILIVFVSLCVAKSIELKTGYSIQKVKDFIWEIVDITLKDDLTGKQFVKRMKAINNPMLEFLENLKNVENIIK